MWGEKDTLNSARGDWKAALHAVKVGPLLQQCCAIQSYLPSNLFLFHSTTTTTTTTNYSIVQHAFKGHADIFTSHCKIGLQLIYQKKKCWKVVRGVMPASHTDESVVDCCSYHQWGQPAWQPAAACTASSCQRSSSRLRRMKVATALLSLYTCSTTLLSVQPSCAPHVFVFLGGGFGKNFVVCLGFTFERPRVWAEGQSWDSKFGDQPQASRLRDAGKVGGQRDESHRSHSESVWQSVPHMCAVTALCLAPSAGVWINSR